jgi:hypothetical protein
MTARTPAAQMVALAAGIAVALSGCSSSGSSSPSGSGDPHQNSLDHAVERINVTRDPLVAAMNQLVVAANHVDAVDTASAGGDLGRARTARAANTLEPAEISHVVAQLPSLLRAYSGALDELSAAATGSDIPVRMAAAVQTVVRAGRAEADADGVFVRAIASGWPAYAVLAGTQLLWFERASGDWYDGKKQAAQEYAVLTSPLRTATNTASSSFGDADETRRAAADEWASTLDEVHPILYPPKKQ